MNIKELSIGNIVEACGCIAVVDEIHDTEVAVKSPKGMAWVPIDEIQPVPITPAILEKSRWAKIDKGLYSCRYKDAEFGVQALDIMDMDNHWYLSVNDLFVIEIKHLHQLQNLLTICEIEIPLTI